MTTVGLIAAAPPSIPLLTRLQRPRLLLALVLLMWVPLTIHVMFGHFISEPLRTGVLLPAIPAALLLYGLAVISWRESPVAVIGVSLVFFWLVVAVSAPFLPLVAFAPHRCV